MELKDLGIATVYSDGEEVWTQCRECGTVITECWTMPADLRLLADDAADHYCGLEPHDVEAG